MNTIALIISILLAQTAGIIGSLFTAQSVTTWYVALEKPFFNPPTWVFGPVWITLYTLMGIAAYLVWKKRAKQSKKVRKALTLYAIQLVLNALWSIIFFGYHVMGWAVVEIVILLMAIILTPRAFWNIDKRAGWLFIPYIAWVSFASILNISLWLIN